MQGHLDSPLDATGRAQALELAPYLAALGLGAVYCSTSGRTRETAALALGERPPPIDYRDELREMTLGAWDGRRWPDVERDAPEAVARFVGGDVDFAIDGAESRVEVRRRGVAAIERIVDEAAAERVLVVSHGAILRAVLCHYAARPLTGPDTLPSLGNCSLSLIEADRTDRVVALR